MHKDIIWGNDEKYTKEFQIQCREEQKKRYDDLMKRLAKEEEEAKNQDVVIGSALRRYEQNARANGEITNVFIKQNLEGKITVARWALALAMGMTLLFKGFWALWILFILLYNWEVKRLKKEALEADLKRGNRK